MKRWTFFTCGVVCHLLFVATFAYMAGFVGNQLVPKTIDMQPTDSLLGAVVIDLGLILLFGLQHSIMARPRFKHLWTRLVPQPIERSTYVLIACVVTWLLMWQWRAIDAVVWDVQQPMARGLLWGMFAGGWLLVFVASLMIDHFDLFGTRQVWLYLHGRPYSPPTFRTPRLYGRMRHPIYVGWAVAFWATPTMTLGHVLFAGVLTLYMVVATLVEERDLVNHYGDVYRAYQRRVPRFMPSFRGVAESSAQLHAVTVSGGSSTGTGFITKRIHFNTHVLADPSWWHWAVTIPLLAAYLLGVGWAIEAAVVLCAAMAVYYLVRLRRLKPFPVQVRLAYIGWLLIGLLPGMHWMMYVTLAGLMARVLFGYCLLARMLSLAWFNRSEPLTFSLFRRVFCGPSDGGLMGGGSVAASIPGIGSCSLHLGGVGIPGQGCESGLPRSPDTAAVGEGVWRAASGPIHVLAGPAAVAVADQE